MVVKAKTPTTINKANNIVKIYKNIFIMGVIFLGVLATGGIVVVSSIV